MTRKKIQVESAASGGMTTVHGDTPPSSIAPQIRKSRRGANAERKNAHPSRAQDAHTHHAVHTAAEEPWAPPEQLPTPPARPGMAQKWVRVSLLRSGEPDPKNVSRKLHEGWKPRMANTASEGVVPPTISSGQFAGAIGVADMILMEMPLEKKLQRDAYFQRKNDMMLEGVENDLNRVERPGVPIQRVRKSTVTTRPPRVAADEKN